MEHRYKALRVIAMLYKILAIIVAVISVIAALAFCGIATFGGAAGTQDGGSALGGMMGGAVGGFIVGIFWILYGGLMALMLYGFGELIMVLLAIEENTRGSLGLMQGMMPGAGSVMPAAPPASPAG